MTPGTGTVKLSRPQRADKRRALLLGALCALLIGSGCFHRSLQAAPAAQSDMRPFDMFFSEGGVLDAQHHWHFRGNPGKVVSRDTVFTMQFFEYDERTHTGIATGAPHMQDPHNVMTADKITIFDAGPAADRRAILEGHVHILHHPEGGQDTNPSGDNVSDLLSHDTTLTCNQLTYYYRTKTGFATGNPEMVGEGSEDGKTVAVSLTTTRLEFDDRRNLYRALGDVVIKDGSRTITSPRMIATAVVRNGRREVQNVDLSPPVHMTGMFDASEQNDTGGTAGASAGATAGATAAPAPSPTPPSGEKKPASPAPPAASTPGAPSPTTPVPSTPTPTTPAPSTPATSTTGARKVAGSNASSRSEASSSVARPPSAVPSAVPSDVPSAVPTPVG